MYGRTHLWTENKARRRTRQAKLKQPTPTPAYTASVSRGEGEGDGEERASVSAGGCRLDDVGGVGAGYVGAVVLADTESMFTLIIMVECVSSAAGSSPFGVGEAGWCCGCGLRGEAGVGRAGFEDRGDTGCGLSVAGVSALALAFALAPATSGVPAPANTSKLGFFFGLIFGFFFVAGLAAWGWLTGVGSFFLSLFRKSTTSSRSSGAFGLLDTAGLPVKGKMCICIYIYI